MVAIEQPQQDEATDAWQPLRGLRVVDFSQLLPGPYTTVLLADLGAEVVRVEPHEGDMMRRLPQPVFRQVNRNKRCIGLDLKTPGAGGIIERLARWADIAVEAFRPGVADRLGIGHQRLASLNPRLIYCSLSGFGQTGPSRNEPGHEISYLAAAGSFFLPGHWSGPARRLGVPMIDMAGGSFSAIAILAALNERNATGKGVRLDLSLLETALALSTVRSGFDAQEDVRGHLWPTNDVFETSDRHLIAFALVEDRFWRNFVEAVHSFAPDLDSPDYANDESRRLNGDALFARMTELLQTRTLDAWLDLFEGRDIPAHPVLTPRQAWQAPHVRARGTVTELAGEQHIPFPVHADGRRGGSVRSLAVEIGMHDEEVLAELGFRKSEIAAFRSSGTLRSQTG